MGMGVGPGTMPDDVPHQVQAIQQVFLHRELMGCMRLIVTAGKVDAADGQPFLLQFQHIRQHPFGLFVTEVPVPGRFQELVTAQDCPAYNGNDVLVASPVRLYHKTAIREEVHPGVAGADTTCFLADKEGQFEYRVLLQAFQGYPNPVLVVRSQVFLPAVFRAVAENDLFGLNGHEVRGAYPLHLVHVRHNAGIVRGVPLGDIQVAGRVFFNTGTRYFLYLFYDEPAHGPLFPARAVNPV